MCNEQNEWMSFLASGRLSRIEKEMLPGGSISHDASPPIRGACKTDSLIKLQFLPVIYSTMNDSFNGQPVPAPVKNGTFQVEQEVSGVGIMRGCIMNREKLTSFRCQHKSWKNGRLCSGWEGGKGRRNNNLHVVTKWRGLKLPSLRPAKNISGKSFPKVTPSNATT